MFGDKKGGRIFAGKALGRNNATGVFTTVTVPGLGQASTMDRGVFDKAVKSANAALREASSSTVTPSSDEKRR
ncbi:hypothetical protein [Methylobacterium brachiatum]|uniref:hypothetical protein n=1 Tax=Methylobacterium brachiatum TaxID=269660 RepID=UPI0008E64EC9|nr:hypothetical protein [Methylobacterium brachiatum]SFJ38656.1 hypothetical protein SAMN02799642_04254 [Methylobacterium brachiatum]